MSLVKGYLLDTHTLIWALASPERLGAKSVEALEDPRNRLFVSAGSAWEISTKYRIGKLPQAQPIVANFEKVVSGLGATMLAITARHALVAGCLEWSHRDPFDRILAVQAMAENLAFVTRDRKFSELSGLRILW